MKRVNLITISLIFWGLVVNGHNITEINTMNYGYEVNVEVNVNSFIEYLVRNNIIEFKKEAIYWFGKTNIAILKKE